MPKFVPSDRSQPCLLPPDMREWVPEDDLVHFVLEAVERVSMSRFRVNERGTGSAQCHPRTMLALPVHCHATGTFGSRRIERATHRDLCVRYLTADSHPDHDTICRFRRENFEAVGEAFLQVLLLARELRLLRVGTVSVDGTKVDANASLRNGIRHDRAEELRAQLQQEIDGLLAEAERTDASDEVDPQRLPAELSRREAPKAKLDRACAELKERAQRRAESERAECERKVAARDARKGSAKGRRPKPPSGKPKPDEQVNPTDADSGVMKKSERHECRQACNAQAVVDADGSRLVLGCRVSRSATDRRELVADVDAVPAAVGVPDRVLADSGCASGGEVAELGGRGMDLLVATGAEGGRRQHDFRPEPAGERPAKEPKAEWIKAMRAKLDEEENRRRCRVRKHTVEPVFGVVRQAMGFRQFLLRGLEKVEGERCLAMLAYNCRRLHNLRAA